MNYKITDNLGNHIFCKRHSKDEALDAVARGDIALPLGHNKDEPIWFVLWEDEEAIDMFFYGDEEPEESVARYIEAGIFWRGQSDISPLRAEQERTMEKLKFETTKRTIDLLKANAVYYRDACKDLAFIRSLLFIANDISTDVLMSTYYILTSDDAYHVLVRHWYMTSEVLPYYSKSLEALGNKWGYTREFLHQEALGNDFLDVITQALAKHDARDGVR